MAVRSRYFTWRIVLLVLAIILFVAAGIVAAGWYDGNSNALAWFGLAAWSASTLP